MLLMDISRLTSQRAQVFELMRDGEWRTLLEIAAQVEGLTTALSARLRDLRKPQFGEHTVQSRPRHGGTWEYRLLVNNGQLEMF